MAQSTVTNRFTPGAILPAFAKLLLSLSMWLIAWAVAWLILSQQNFYYTVWYKLLDIEQTIITYGAQNRFGKQNFADTALAQHQRLFAEIVDSINNAGEGLKSIRYRLDPESKQSYLLLTQAEVQHLQDVADVVTVARWVVLVALIATIVLMLYLYCTRQLPASLKQQSKYSFLTIIVVVMLVFVIGAEAVFYWLHEVIFADHQWFYYYQDSLMSTLMQAPNIFAPIAITWLVMAVIVWWLITALLGQFYIAQHQKTQQ